MSPLDRSSAGDWTVDDAWEATKFSFFEVANIVRNGVARAWNMTNKKMRFVGGLAIFLYVPLNV
jgi:hypothetical protein